MQFRSGRAGLKCLSPVFAAFALLFVVGSPAQAASQALRKAVISPGSGTVGVDRTYSYYISSKADRSGFNPVVFALHDNGQTAEQFAEQSGWVKIAEDNGLVVVFPEPANKTWSPYSGYENAYLKTVYNHVQAHLTAEPPSGAPQRPGRPPPDRINTWASWQYITGEGAGAVAAQEFTIDNPGLVAAIATLGGKAYPAAYAHGGEPAQGYLLDQRGGKTATPSWRPLKKEVPVAAWLFTAGDPSPEQARLADYWKRDDAVAASPTVRTVANLRTVIYSAPGSPGHEVRTTAAAAGARYDSAMAAAIWDDFFSHLARWTDSPNGTLGTMLTKAEVNRTFEAGQTKVGDIAYKYYVKTPSSYRPGQSPPLVISLHGGLFPAWMYLSQIRMHEVGEREGFITLYLNGTDNFWDFTIPDSPDVQAIQNVIDEAVRKYGVDRSRIYLQGFSFGSGMTHVEGLLHPQLFAAIAPNSGIGDFAPPVLAAIDRMKAQHDVRMPTFIVYGSVDAPASTDGKIPAKGVLRTALDYLKTYDHITTPDRIERFDSPNTEPYDILIPGGRASVSGVDAHYPQGRFHRYDYVSDDPKGLPLLSFLWVTDMPHGNDPHQAQMVWDYFKHWKRNPDGSLAYSAK
ncbi:MAG TPA: PHB depolymerase family esterase [Caulobacteraceae bacterium]|nr:PHB depolymerase family esterase [Caulobacteraceae bacterium]